jgi:cell division protein FtsB
MAIMILYAYLAFHAFSGSQGLMNWMNKEDQAVVLKSRLENIKSERLALERRVDALDVAHLDLDALDALSREKLHYSHPKDMTIWLDPKG